MIAHLMPPPPEVIVLFIIEGFLIFILWRVHKGEIVKRRAMKPDNSIILLARLDTDQEWNQVTNPSDSDLLRAFSFLSNEFNQYVEYKNCGVVYRFIRAKDLSEYITRGNDETQPQGGSLHQTAQAE